jgi:hypothetical protein
MVGVGVLVGLAAGIACGRLTESLLFEIKATVKTVRPPLDTLSLDIRVRAKGKKGFKGNWVAY